MNDSGIVNLCRVSNEETRLDAFEIKGLRRMLRVSWTAKKTNEWVLNKAGVKRELLHTVKARKLAWSHHEKTRGLPGERDNARNNARCTKARKATHGLDGQHQDVDRTLRGRVNQNDRGQGEMEKVRPWCGQPSDRGRLKIRSDSSRATRRNLCTSAFPALFAGKQNRFAN